MERPRLSFKGQEGDQNAIRSCSVVALVQTFSLLPFGHGPALFRLQDTFTFLKGAGYQLYLQLASLDTTHNGAFCTSLCSCFLGFFLPLFHLGFALFSTPSRGLQQETCS